MCEHLEVGEFGVFKIERAGGKQVVATLLKCASCGKLLTLDCQVIREEDVVERLGMTRENMRTLTVQLNSDIYEKIEDLTSREDTRGDLSKITNELLALGLHQYTKLLPKGAE